MTRADGGSSQPEEPVPIYPNQGIGSTLPTAGWARRIVALLLDWWMALVVAIALYDRSAVAQIVIFAVMQVVLVGTIGSSVGHFVCRLQVQRATGGWAGPWRAVLRTALLCLVIPPVVTVKGGRRGLHDVAAGTVITRR